jgi:hypothetical protein
MQRRPAEYVRQKPANSNSPEDREVENEIEIQFHLKEILY